MTAILFIGDVVARAGRRVVRDLLPGLRDELELDFVVCNGENAAGGIGITPKEADELFRAGVDVITLGNHTYRHREVWPYLDEQPNILRPANFLRSQPGRGTCVFERELLAQPGEQVLERAAARGGDDVADEEDGRHVLHRTRADVLQPPGGAY